MSLRAGPVPPNGVAAVVLGGENGALPILRSLARGGLRSCIVASERPQDPTFHSRYCGMKVVLQRFDPSTDAQNLRTLIGISASLHRRPVLFWGSDREVLFINRNREELERWYRFVFADRELTDDLVDKGRFAGLARTHDLPVPETRCFSNPAEILLHRHELPYPCTIKPTYMNSWYTGEVIRRFGTYKHALRRLEGPDELEPYLALLPNLDRGVVVQPFIEGGDGELFSFHAYIDADGEPMGCFIGRKIRTNPIHFGGSAYVETVHRPELAKMCLEICARIGFKGIVKIDCKRDSATCRYLILEFNPRFNLWEYLGAFAGLNLPMIWYDDLSGNGCRANFSYREGRKWLYLAGDLRAYPAYTRAGEWTLLRWLGSYFARKVYHTFDWRDPLPLLYSLPRFLRRKASRWNARLGGGAAKSSRAGAYGVPRPLGKAHAKVQA